MGVVYRNKREIPIPEGMLINHNDGRVYTITTGVNGKRIRTVYGYATSETTMHVNETFKAEFPNLWEQYYGTEEIYAYNLQCGMYALTLGIGHTTNLYPVVQEVFGPEYGNAIIDYSMYSIMSRLDVTHLFQETMDAQVLFSSKPYSDSWYSSLFAHKITPDQVHRLKIRWMQECKISGVSKVWISIDGSNSNCQLSKSDLSQKGEAKSKNNLNIVSYIYAVDASSGKPITWFVNNGSMVDSKAFNEICAFLADNDIGIEGVIIDREFCTMDVINLVQKSGFEYILMLQSDTHGHVRMLDDYSETIRWKAEYCISSDGIFGITDYKKLFGIHDHQTYVNLYFDGANGSSRSITLIRKIMEQAEAMKISLDEGKVPSVPKDLKAYLSVVDENGTKKVVCDYTAWQKSMDTKGFYSIASSADRGAREVHELYHLRDASETQFMIMKSMEGYDALRVQSTRSIESKFAICFISSIIRSELLRACRANGYDTNRMVREVGRIKLQLRNDHRYYAVMNHSVRQKELLSVFGIYPESFEKIALDVTHRLSDPLNSQERKMPSDIIPPSRKRGRPSTKTSTSEKTKNRPGRPRKNRADNKHDSEEASTEKRGRGRPPGSRNKKTLERLAKHPDIENQPKRGRGRPKGSLNKKTLERLEKEKNSQQSTKRGRGRPPGSLNKKTLERLS